LVDETFNFGEDWAIQLVIHEIGHNWENELNNFWEETPSAADGTPLTFEGWKSLSGWEDGTADNDAKFVSGYAETNAVEDFAETWLAYWMQRAGRDLVFGGGGAGDPLDDEDVERKLAFIDALVDQLT
jgi:hypothetical protein